MIKNVKIMKMKFIYVVLVALLLGSQMTLSAQNRDNKEKKQRPTQEQMMHFGRAFLAIAALATTPTCSHRAAVPSMSSFAALTLFW